MSQQLSKKRPRSTEVSPDPLIPIRLDLTLDNHRVQESFSWNAAESHITPHTFAALLLNDLNLPDLHRNQVAEAIQEQITAFVPPTRPTNESRHIVRLDLRIGRIVLRDQFEWDLSARNSPEAFAERLCADVGLASQHVPAVAHAVREQLLEVSEFREKRVPCPVLKGPADVVRNGEQWQPAVECLSFEETERLERKERREARLVRRNRGKAEVYAKPSRRRSRSSRRR